MAAKEGQDLSSIPIEPDAGSEATRSADELLQFVEEAATEFVATMKRGGSATEGWTKPGAYTRSASAMDRLLQRLASSQIWGEANRIPSSRLWDIAGEILSVGSLQLRARAKPRGYAGDYVMLDRICEDWRCADELGRHFDQYFQTQHAPRAVRQRCELLAEIMLTEWRRQTPVNPKGRFHVVSIGSGPAVELCRAANALSTDERRLKVTLIDIDPDALDHARASLERHLANEQIVCVRENLFRLPTKKAAVVTEPADVVFCAGLFDYLEDAQAVAMLKMMRSWLLPSGRLLAFNFSTSNPTRAYMEWIGNWYLKYRTLEEMEDLARQAGIPVGNFSASSESLGVNLYIDARSEDGDG